MKNILNHKKRKKYPLIVSIDEQLIELIYHLISAEMNQNPNEIFNINSQYRLISSNSTLRELCLYKTFEEENIKDNEILLILRPETIKSKKGEKSKSSKSYIRFIRYR